MRKKGALELSVSTIVVLILSLSMLVLGLVMVNKIMCGAIIGIDNLNEQTRQEIIDLFGENEKLVIKETENKISKDVLYGVGFAIRNSNTASNEFSYEVRVSELGSCLISESEALDFIQIGHGSSMSIPSGGDYSGLIKFLVPKNIENCNLRYGIEVTNDGEVYDSKEFDVSIVKKGFSKNFC